MSLRVLLLDKNCDVNVLPLKDGAKYDTVICLFWAAPSTRDRLVQSFGCECFSWYDILGDKVKHEYEAYSIVQKICGGGSSYRGLPWRFDMIGLLYYECEHLSKLSAVVDFLFSIEHRKGGGEIVADCVLTEENTGFLKMVAEEIERPESVQLRLLNRSQGSERQHAERNSFLKRFLRQFRNAVITQNWEAQLWFLLEKMDGSYEKRCKWSVHRRSKAPNEGGAIFFSSYLNNSRVLQGYEKSIPLEVRWLVNNYYADKGIRRNPSTIVEWLWQYSPRCFVKVRDLEGIADDLDKSGMEGLFCRWLSRSTIWEQWRSKQLASMANLTECWENCLNVVNPRLVVVASQWGIEGWFTHIAQKKGIPVVQIMHGVMGGFFYTQTDIISDILIVPGDFWKDLWPEDQRKKISVFNPHGYIKKVRKEKGRPLRRLTFFSWPLVNLRSFNMSEFMRGFIHIFQKVLSSKHNEIYIRTHPLENPSDFVRWWRRLHGALPERLYIESGKKGGLEEVLERTDVALMFRSTVILNCFANGIPVIMPGWVDFGWDKASMKDIPGLYLAADFKDIEDTLIRWLSVPPKMEPDTIRYFIRPSGDGEEEFRVIVNKVVATSKPFPR